MFRTSVTVQMCLIQSYGEVFLSIERFPDIGLEGGEATRGTPWQVFRIRLYPRVNDGEILLKGLSYIVNESSQIR